MSSSCSATNLNLLDIRKVTISALTTLLDGGKYIEIEDIEQIASAQQCVFIARIKIKQLKYESPAKNTENETDVTSCSEIISQKKHENMSQNPLIQSLKDSNGRLVVRIWKGGASWWNLNSNCDHNYIEVAKAEVAGYRVAQRALSIYSQHCKTIESDRIESRWNSTAVIIPEVLYFSLDNKKLHTEERFSSVPSFPLAIFSYVGAGSNAIVATTDNEIDDSNKTSDAKWVFCDAISRNMVKERREFGYNEPHPRHGRVNVGEALRYATRVLDSVIFPIHSAFFLDYLSRKSLKSQIDKSFFGLRDETTNALLRNDMHALSRLYNGKNLNENKVISSFQYYDMIELYQESLLSLNNAISTENQDADMVCDRHPLLINILKECVENLTSEANLYHPDLINGCSKDAIDAIPPVLCHMDLQPQNMIMRRSLAYFSTESFTAKSSYMPHIASVLDWEESCLADPRFELIMLCRKVVADRFQADVLWEHYSKVMEKRFELPYNIFGPIEPWLKLEAVHSLFALTTQEMNLQGGGRKPWEAKTDIRGKISRELSRLVDLGWHFCRLDME